MDAFRLNQSKFNDAMKTAFSGGPFAEMAKRNMAMFEAAASAFVPGTKAENASEISALKAQIAELQAKVDKLDS